MSRRGTIRKEPQKKKQQNLKLNILFISLTYPVFESVKEILKILHILLTPNNGHELVFYEIPIASIKYNRNLKNHLVK